MKAGLGKLTSYKLRFKVVGLYDLPGRRKRITYAGVRL